MIDSGCQQSAPPSSDGVEALNATLREPSSVGGNLPESNSNACSQCGYPVSSSAEECPVCHAQLNASRNNQARMDDNNNRRSRQNRMGRPAGGTINPWATPSSGESFCTLRIIPWQNEKVAYEPVSYSGESIMLNRSNTDSNNNSITSREQAVMTHENGEWFIENRSDLQTTLIRVDRRLKLEDGDVIVLGNRMFEFKKG